MGTMRSGGLPPKDASSGEAVEVRAMELAVQQVLAHSASMAFLQDEAGAWLWAGSGTEGSGGKADRGIGLDSLLSEKDRTRIAELQASVRESGTNAHGRLSLSLGGEAGVYEVAVRRIEGKSAEEGAAFLTVLTPAGERERDGENRQALLLSDLAHRTRNHFSMIDSLIRLQIAESRDSLVRDALSELHQRIATLSAVHALLSEEPSSEPVDLAKLLTSLTTAFSSLYGKSGAVTVTLTVEPLSLDSRKATGVGLIVNELLTNAYKYAFPQGKRGEISCRVHRTEDGMAEISVRDDGVGFASPRSDDGSGLGHRLIEALSEELGARKTVCSGAGGTVVSITVPL